MKNESMNDNIFKEIMETELKDIKEYSQSCRDYVYSLADDKGQIDNSLVVEYREFKELIKICYGESEEVINTRYHDLYLNSEFNEFNKSVIVPYACFQVTVNVMKDDKNTSADSIDFDLLAPNPIYVIAPIEWVSEKIQKELLLKGKRLADKLEQTLKDFDELKGFARFIPTVFGKTQTEKEEVINSIKADCFNNSQLNGKITAQMFEFLNHKLTEVLHRMQGLFFYVRHSLDYKLMKGTEQSLAEFKKYIKGEIRTKQAEDKEDKNGKAQMQERQESMQGQTQTSADKQTQTGTDEYADEYSQYQLKESVDKHSQVEEEPLNELSEQEKEEVENG